MLGTGALDAVLLGLLGLLVGSFLNVVVHRLPKMMEQRWAAECAELHAADSHSAPAAPTFNLMVPRSRCPHCKAGISPRYPLVELTNAALFAWCGWQWGLSATAMAWSGFAAAVLALACIDWDTTLLPDDITLPLLWAGLCAAALHITSTELGSALWGAVGGYMSLWLVYWAFKLATGKEGMGYGDFKLFAALGAWFGWQALVPIILMASLIGAAVGIALKLNSRLREGGYVPFGPFLALAGLTSLFFGPQAILSTLGL